MKSREFSVVSMTRGTKKYVSHLESKGKIHSVFRRTINLVIPEGTLLTLANSEIKNGPQTLLIPNFYPKDQLIEPGMTFVIKNQQILIAEKWRVDYQSAETASLPKPIFPIKGDFHKLAKGVIIAREMLTQSEKYQHQSTAKNLFQQVSGELLTKNCQILIGAVKRKNLRDIAKALPSIIGLGQGLTPAGDDFLTGLFLITALDRYPERWLLNEFKEQFQVIKGRTNLISQEQMDWALQGEGREQLMVFVEDLLTLRGATTLEQSLQAVIELGFSSGMDILDGIFTGIMLTIQLGGITNGIKC